MAIISNYMIIYYLNCLLKAATSLRVSSGLQRQIFSLPLKGHNTQHSGHKGNFFQSELFVEIYSKSLVRAICKVLLMKFS